ncbi:MAG: hypothetical protein ACTHLO_07710 [Pseudolabrys sp.]
MTETTRERTRAPVGAIVVFMFAALLYIATITNVSDVHGSDAAGRGMASAFAAIFGVALWLSLAVLLAIAAIKGRMPFWAGASMLVLHPLGGIACFAAAGLYAAQGGYWLLVPGLLPPLVAFYALAMRVPAFTLPLTPVSAVVVSVALLMSLAPLTMHFVGTHPSEAQQAKARADAEAEQAARDQAEREAREQELAAFKRLGPDSSLRDYLTYLTSGDPRFREAPAGARLVKTRQTDAVALLRQGHIGDMPDLRSLDLAATPDLCAAYDFGLRVEAMKVQRGRGAWLTAAMNLEWQLPNIKWLAGAGCDLDPSLTLLEKNVREVSDSERLNKFADTLHGFRKAP